MSLPPFPEFDRQGYLDPPDDVLLDYERSMKEAYAARLRLAVEAFNLISKLGDDPYLHDDHCIAAIRKANEALAAIGEVPQG